MTDEPSGPAEPANQPATRDTVSTTTRSTVQLADGIYAIRHEDAPDAFPQGNTTVIVGEREAMVIDSCYLPSSAESDVAQILEWTAKPVRYLLNTHWHYDHTMGNGVYRDAFPGISIVAHAETRRQIAGYNPQWFRNFGKRGDQFRQAIASGKDSNGRPLTAGEIAEYESALEGLAPVGAEFEPLAARTDLAPDVGFDRELHIDLGGREVRLLHLGRGNTAGDVAAHLPGEKILVAGDLLDHPVPYLGGGYPVEEIATLEALARLDPDAATRIPGTSPQPNEGSSSSTGRTRHSAIRSLISRSSCGERRISRFDRAFVTPTSTPGPGSRRTTGSNAPPSSR